MLGKVFSCGVFPFNKVREYLLLFVEILATLYLNSATWSVACDVNCGSWLVPCHCSLNTQFLPTQHNKPPISVEKIDIYRDMYLDSECAAICLMAASYGHTVQKLSVLWTVLKGTWALRLFWKGMTNLRWQVESQYISLNESPVVLTWTGEIKQGEKRN